MLSLGTAGQPESGTYGHIIYGGYLNPAIHRESKNNHIGKKIVSSEFNTSVVERVYRIKKPQINIIEDFILCKKKKKN